MSINALRIRPNRPVSTGGSSSGWRSVPGGQTRGAWVARCVERSSDKGDNLVTRDGQSESTRRTRRPWGRVKGNGGKLLRFGPGLKKRRAPAGGLRDVGPPDLRDGGEGSCARLRHAIQPPDMVRRAVAAGLALALMAGPASAAPPVVGGGAPPAVSGDDAGSGSASATPGTGAGVQGSGSGAPVAAAASDCGPGRRPRRRSPGPRAGPGRDPAAARTTAAATDRRPAPRRSRST